MRVFSDADGTFFSHPEIWGQIQAVVTGETWQKFDEFISRWTGPRKPVFFNPTDDEEINLLSIVNHKASIINKCEVDKFFEDQKEQVDMLKILCPNCKIVLVKGENTFL